MLKPNKRKLRVIEYLLPSATWCAATITLGIFILITGDILLRSDGLFSFEFISSNPASAGRTGGVFSVLISTALIVTVCAVAALPVALGAVFFLFLFSERNSFLANIIRMCLDILASTPSIVFGLFGSAFFCIYLKLGFSILSGGLTLACMVLPSVIRMTEEGLIAIPREHLLNGTALGISKTSIFFHILLPTAAPAVSAALLLGIGRALSETAALLFTSGYVLRTPESLFDSGRALSIHIYDLAMNIPGGDLNAYRSAAVLLVVLLLVNSSALITMNHCIKRIQRK